MATYSIKNLFWGYKSLRILDDMYRNVTTTRTHGMVNHMLNSVGASLHHFIRKKLL